MKENRIITPAAEDQPEDITLPYDSLDEQSHQPGRGTLSTSRKLIEIALKLLAVSIILFVLWRQFADVKIDKVLSLLDSAGFAVFLVLIPPLLQLFAETLGLALCIPGRLSLKRFFKVLPVRIGCDALLTSLPAGVVAAETLRPVWLRRACKIPIEKSVAACLMGKINMAAGEGLFLTIAVVLAGIGGHAYSGTLSGHMLIVPSVALVVVFASVVYIYSGARITQLISLLKRIGWYRWRRFLSRIEPSAGRIDETILFFARKDRRAVYASLTAFVGGWILLGCESYLILRLLGQDVSLGQGLLMEGTASVLRIAFFFIPSAFGATEAAYVSLITGYGASHPAAVALAFIAIKRSQELLWIAMGYIVLFVSGKRKRERMEQF